MALSRIISVLCFTLAIKATALARPIDDLGTVEFPNSCAEAVQPQLQRAVALPNTDAVPFWVRILIAKGPPPSRGEQTLSAGTLGLRAFGLRELEYAPSSLETGFIIQHAYSVSEYLLRSGKRLEEGESIGVEGQAHFTVSYANKGELVSSPVARLSLQSKR